MALPRDHGKQNRYLGQRVYCMLVILEHAYSRMPSSEMFTEDQAR